MSEPNGSIQDNQFCPKVDRACMGWFGGECSFNTVVHEAFLGHMKQQTPIGDVPVLNKLVKGKEEAVRNSYDNVAVQLAQVVLSAGNDFSPDQCEPVKFASGLFDISPVGQVGVLSPEPRMSSRPVTVPFEQDDDEPGRTGGLKTPVVSSVRVPVPRLAILPKQG